VSSLAVWKEGVPDYGSDGCWVSVYEHHWDHGGWEAIFDEGSYNCDAFDRHENGVHHDSMSAMRVRGKDCNVVLWGDCFSGWAAGPYVEGDYDMGALEA